MKRLTIAIVEDEQAHCDILQHYINKWKSSKDDICVIVKSYKSAESFLFQWEDDLPDLIFVDIQMPGINGMEMARKIRENDRNVILVFTTGIADYVQEGYEVEALHYLLKPLDEEKVCRCLDRLLEKEENAACHTFMTNEGAIKLKEQDIYYIEARGHYCIANVKDGGAGTEIPLKESLTDICKILEENAFIKCHRSYLCRLEHIHRIDRTELILDNGSSIPVSRRLYNDVVRGFVQHFRRL